MYAGSAFLKDNKSNFNNKKVFCVSVNWAIIISVHQYPYIWSTGPLEMILIEIGNQIHYLWFKKCTWNCQKYMPFWLKSNELKYNKLRSITSIHKYQFE